LTARGPAIDNQFMIAAKEAFRNLHKTGENTAVWTIPTDLSYFDGHFPGNPIFPAVGIVDATLYFLQMIAGREVYVSHFSVAKFLSPIQPGQTVLIGLNALNEKEWQADWKDEGSQKLLATLRFHL